MGAPPPPPGGSGMGAGMGAGAGAGAGGAGAPPPPPPGRGQGAPPPPPPGCSPGGPNLLAQLVQAMQLVAAALPPLGPGAPPRVKIPPPIFKGLPGERPEAHLMRANDWMDTYLIPVVQKPANFKHTLDHLAREWYDSLVMPIAWNELQQQFSRYFSTQGRSIKHLHDKWRTFPLPQVKMI